MKKETREYLNNQFNYFQKLSELQFDHFMRVFYFWTIIVTAPLSAGLVSDISQIDSQPFGILLLLIGLIGIFLTVKIFDIRGSQLRYIAQINQIRYIFETEIKKNDKRYFYQSLFPPWKDLRETAYEDFGMKMAITMSFINAIFLGFALRVLVNSNIVGLLTFAVAVSFGIIWYRDFVKLKVPLPEDYLPNDYLPKKLKNSTSQE